MAGFGRLERGRAARPISDINVTPLIDVMLVLLVIFIVTAPLLAQRLALDLPQAQAARASATAHFITLALDAQGQLFLGEQPLPRAQLAERVQQAARQQPELEVQLRVDRRVPYGEVAALIDVVQAAGLSRIGFVTEAAPPMPAVGATAAPGPLR